MRLTLEEIQKQLKAIQNRYNLYNFDDESIFGYSILIMHDKEEEKERTEKEKESFLQHIIDNHSRELVKEYKHIVISKGKYGKYYIQIKRGERLYPITEIYVSDRLGTTVENVYETAEAIEKIHTQGYVESKVEFPTGEIIFANFFKNSKMDDYAFEVPEDIKYTDQFSINHSLGEQRTMEVLSQIHGLCYVQLGNTSAAVYKVSDDKIVMINPWVEDYEEDTVIKIPDEWELIGEVCCDVWRVECIDQQNFAKGDTAPFEKYEYNKPFMGKVNPGTWHVKCRYHHMNDDKEIKSGRIPIWVELNRIK